MNFWKENAILSPTVLYATGKIVRDGSSKMRGCVGRWGGEKFRERKKGLSEEGYEEDTYVI